MEILEKVVEEKEMKIEKLKVEIEDLLNLKMIHNVYKTENPSDKFFIWCQKNGYELSKYQINLLDKIEF